MKLIAQLSGRYWLYCTLYFGQVSNKSTLGQHNSDWIQCYQDKCIWCCSSLWKTRQLLLNFMSFYCSNICGVKISWRSLGSKMVIYFKVHFYPYEEIKQKKKWGTWKPMFMYKYTTMTWTSIIKFGVCHFLLTKKRVNQANFSFVLWFLC